MTIAVVGEVLVDLVWPMGTDRIVPHPGGSPANVAIGLHRLDRQVTLLSCWGDDPPGALIDAYLSATGVDVRRLPSRSRCSTVAHAYLDPNTGSATYDFLAAWDPIEISVPADTTLIHTGSLAAVIEPGATPILKTCRGLRNRLGCAVSIDLNVRPAALPDRATYRAQIERLTREADIVKASDEDLTWLYPDLDPDNAARALLKLGPELVVLTRGSQGATGLTAEHEVTLPAPEVRVADTIGAGDAFQAALLDALVQHDAGIRIPTTAAELTSVLHRCITAGAIACTRPGARPPTRQEINAHCPHPQGELE
jgi:fructokinase